MHKSSDKEHLLKQVGIGTRLHDASVFNTYKPNNEKVKLNVLYRGVLSWNMLDADVINMSFNKFKKTTKKCCKGYHLSLLCFTFYFTYNCKLNLDLYFIHM